MRSLGALRVPSLRRLWLAAAIAAVGDDLFRVAMVWLAVEAIGSLAAWLPALQAGTLIVVSFWGGRVLGADARTMIGVNLVRVFVALVPVVVVMIGFQPIGALVFAAGMFAACRASFEPAMQASLPRLSANEAMLLSSNALFDATNRLARLVGPTLAAALVLVIPVIHLLTVQAVMALMALLLVISLRRHLPPFEAARGAANSIITGFRLVHGHKVLRIAVGANVISHGTWVVVITIGMALLIDERHPAVFGLPGAGAYGLVIGAYGTGNLAGNLFAASRPNPPGIAAMFGGEMVMGCGFLGIGLVGLLASDSWLVPGLMIVAAMGAHGASFHDMPIALMVQRFPPHFIAAVHRARMVIQQSGILTALFISPLFFDRFGAARTIIGAGIIHVMVGAIAWIFAARAERAAPAPA